MALARLFQKTVIAHEDLEKQSMYSNNRKYSRKLSRRSRIKTINLLSYKAETKSVKPRNTSKECLKCGDGEAKRLNGTLICRCCGLKINVQLAAAVNIWLRAQGLKPSRRNWRRIEPALNKTTLTLDLKGGKLVPAPNPHGVRPT